jgi:ABC-type glutathione transport system ATPase component
MLDPLTQARIVRLLKRIQADRGIGMVLISHDPALVDRFCGKIYQLKAGRLDANKY